MEKGGGNMKRILLIATALLGYTCLISANGSGYQSLNAASKDDIVRISGGSFMMGDKWGDGESDEKPLHRVTFTYSFYIGKHEVTFEEYDAFCDALGRDKPSDWNWGRARNSVILVSWWDAIAYCNWLSISEGFPEAYDGAGNLLDKDGNPTSDVTKVTGYRLPTEAEWEYAASGGPAGNEYRYSGSATSDDVAWSNSNSSGKTHEIGTKLPNEQGIYDMSGNVWEWCSDSYESYLSLERTNPCSNTGNLKVARGGSWNDHLSYVRLAKRIAIPTDYKNIDLGFRIARTVQ